MASKRKWIALGYNLPINPSKNRVYVWRKLKEAGAVYYKSGMAVLPYRKEELSFFRWLSEKINGIGGEASIIEICFIDQKDERELIEKFIEQSKQEYREVLTQCRKIYDALLMSKMGKEEIEKLLEGDLLKLAKKYKRIRSRDFFKLPLAQEIEYGLADIEAILRMSANDFSIQMKRIWT
jgi:hypothetical protein